MTKEGRRRVSREQVRNNAKASGGGWQIFRLPSGVKEWVPQKPGSCDIDILPYETKSPMHPDRVEPGTIWYKYPFMVHHQIGVLKESFVCPSSVGKPCPICEEAAKLQKQGVDDETVSKLWAQKFVAYNILNPDDPSSLAILALSRGKFAAPLEKELDEAPDSLLAFYDVQDGKTLTVRFSEASFRGQKYLEATRFDFTARPDMDEDSVLGATLCLEDILDVVSYETLKKKFFQYSESSDETDEKEESKKKEEEPAKVNPFGRKATVDQTTKEQPTESSKKNPFSTKTKTTTEVQDTPKKKEEDDIPFDSTTKSEPKSDVKKKEQKATPTTTGVCPNGHNFGSDVDSFDDCDDCPNWSECEAKST